MSVQGWARAALVSLLFGACGDSSTTNGTGQPSATTVGDQTTIVIGPDGSSSTIDVPPPGDTTPDGSSVTSSGGGAGIVAVDANGPPGSFALGILSPSVSSEVVVEVRTQSGADPQQASIDHLTSVLRDATGKTVTVTQGPGIDGEAKSWSGDDLRSTAGAGAAQGGGRSVIHLLFVHGIYSDDNTVLGVAARGDLAAIFVDQVAAASTPLIGSSAIETAVVMHEVGHLLGLVDLYLHTGREDPEHPGHSTNSGSVMYWAVESNLVADILLGGPPTNFDSADLADLETIRNSG